MALDRAVSDLADQSWEVVDAALDVIIAEGSAASPSTAAAATGALIALLSDPSFESRSLGSTTEDMCLEALAVLGSSAVPALPLLRSRMEDVWPDKHCGSILKFGALLKCFAAISPRHALSYCRLGLEEEGKGTTVQKVIIFLEIAFGLGEISIPTLKSFCGLFAGYRGKACAATISAIRRGETRLSLPSY